MQIVLSTRNEDKILQAQAVFANSKFSLIGLNEAGIAGKGEETGETLQENALAKAMFAHERRPDLWAISDDTGISIEALNGLPGVHTADWNGGHTDTFQKTLWILEQLEHESNRMAVFRTVVALVSPSGQTYFFEGSVSGKILRAPRAAFQPSMPYGSIFVPIGSQKVWAEMTVEEENAISHRGQAFRQAREFLESL